MCWASFIGQPVAGLLCFQVYQEIEDHPALVKTMEDYLEDHNAMTSKPMSLVLFQNAIEHVARISRIICQPMGNALLVGVGGSGRKSLTILAVSVADYKLFQIEISKSYGMIEWREDLRKVLTMAGAENRWADLLPHVFSRKPNSTTRICSRETSNTPDKR